jgi:hydroxymethylglutaryl-CoA lyase
VDVADTIGVGTPLKVQAAIEATLKHYGVDAVSGHFHDTYGQALSNTLAALEMGVWNFQSSVAGLGGCPYAKGATGNVAPEDVVYLLHGMGIHTGQARGLRGHRPWNCKSGWRISWLRGPSRSRPARARCCR